MDEAADGEALIGYEMIITYNSQQQIGDRYYDKRIKQEIFCKPSAEGVFNSPI